MRALVPVCCVTNLRGAKINTIITVTALLKQIWVIWGNKLRYGTITACPRILILLLKVFIDCDLRELKVLGCGG